MAAKSNVPDAITITEIQMTEMRFNLVGLTPLMPHSASAHAKGQLLYPSPRKNAAERATTMKHDPFAEYRDAAYQFSDIEVGETRLYQPASSIKAAIRDVAIDMVGAKKSQIGRLTTIVGERLPLYGTTKLKTMLVRSSDMNRTPDIRTLPCLKRWAVPNVTVSFVGSLIKESSVANLMANAGIIIGVGDGRPQKGYFDFGTWRLAADDDEELLDIIATGGREAQERALAEAEFYDLETEKLIEWFQAEKEKRSAAPPAHTKRRTAVAPPAVSPKKNGKEKHA
jgi:hypothetical protein